MISNSYWRIMSPYNYNYNLTDNPKKIIDEAMKFYTINKPSAEERSALGIYKGSEYENINTNKNAAYKKQADILDKYLSDSPLESDIQLRRDDYSYACLNDLLFNDGVSLGDVMKNPEKYKDKLSEISSLNGKSYVNNRFMSTTADSNGTFFGCPIRWDLTVKSGTGAAFLDSIGINREAEFLINRNSKITIEGIEISGKNIKLKVTVEPATPEEIAQQRKITQERETRIKQQDTEIYNQTVSDLKNAKTAEDINRIKENIASVSVPEKRVELNKMADSKLNEINKARV